MIIVFGIHIIGKTDGFASWGVCENCGAFGAQRNYTAREWFHLFWIPVLPYTSRSRFVMHCSQCERYKKFSKRQLPKAVAEISQLCATALDKLKRGNHFYPGLDGSRCLAALDVLESAKYLACFGDIERADSAVAAAASLCAPIEGHLLRGGYLEFRGQVDDAVNEYRAMDALKPDYGLPYAVYAEFAANHGHANEAVDIIRRGLDVEGNDLSMRLALFDFCIRAQRHSDAVSAAERALELAPDLARDKAFKKTLKRARKMAAKG